MRSIIKLANYFEYQLYAFAAAELDFLIEKYPAQADAIKRLPKKYLNWLYARYSENAPIQELHPLPDTIPTLENYSKSESAISQKYRENEYFKNKIDNKFNPSSRGWQNPSDIGKVSIDDMELILALTTSKAAKIDLKPTNIEGDKIGKVGEWNIWLPSSRDNSIAIAQYDMNYDTDMLEPRTDWCTARVYASNLFYNYIGGLGGNLMLFYIIKDNAQKNNDNDYLSLGFINGQPVFKGNGGVSVDRANKGLTDEKLRSIWGGNYDKIMQIMTAKNNGLGGVSPAMKKIQEAAQDVKKYKAMIAGNGLVDRLLLNNKMAETTESKDVLSAIVNNSNAADKKAENADEINSYQIDVLESVARNTAADSTILTAIINKTDNPYALTEVAKNPAADSTILTAIRNKLTDIINNTYNSDVLREVAKNLAADSTILTAIINKTDDPYALTEAAKNPAADSTILTAIRNKLSDIINKTDNPYALREAAKNPAADSTILTAIRNKLSDIINKTDNPYVLREFAKNLAADSTILTAIINKTDDPYALTGVAKNPAADSTILTAIINKTDDTDVLEAVKNRKKELTAQASIINYIYKKANNYYLLAKYC